MTPQHLNRLRLLPDKYLISQEPANFDQQYMSLIHSYTAHSASKNESDQFSGNIKASVNSFDLSLLLKMALNKIPQIPFEYILDVFRWDIFSGAVNFEDANDYFWTLLQNEQGIHQPDHRNRRKMFDAGAKFHVADNTPFVR